MEFFLILNWNKYKSLTKRCECAAQNSVYLFSIIFYSYLSIWYGRVQAFKPMWVKVLSCDVMSRFGSFICVILFIVLPITSIRIAWQQEESQNIYRISSLSRPNASNSPSQKRVKNPLTCTKRLMSIHRPFGRPNLHRRWELGRKTIWHEQPSPHREREWSPWNDMYKLQIRYRLVLGIVVVVLFLLVNFVRFSLVFTVWWERLCELWEM